MGTKLILGSSSPYRKSLLQRLNIPFDCVSPNIDETPLENENAEELVKRLAYEKANTIASKIPDDEHCLIIGSDQVAVFKDTILGKPEKFDNAVEQLTLFSGQKVEFITSLCLLNNNTKKFDLTISKYYVYFRVLTQKEIISYLEADKPFDCAGSFKCEGLGITLFEKMEGDDPNSLIGLPLINLCKSLRKMGLKLLETNVQH